MAAPAEARIELIGTDLLRQIMRQARVGSLVNLYASGGDSLGVWLVGSVTLWDVGRVIRTQAQRMNPEILYTRLNSWHFHARNHFDNLEKGEKLAIIDILKRKGAESRRLHKYLIDRRDPCLR